MKKMLVALLVVLTVAMATLFAEASSIDAHSPSMGNNKAGDAKHYLSSLMEDKGMYKVGKSYFSLHPATAQQISAMLSWLTGKEVKFEEEPTRENLVKELALLLKLKEYQIEAILLKTRLEQLTVRELNYCILCLIEHPLTASKAVNAIPAKEELYESLTLKVTEEAVAILDIEMLEWFLPTYISISGNCQLLETITEKLNALNATFRQNNKFATSLNTKMLLVTLVYTGSWTHQMALRPDFQVFDSEYENKIEDFWKAYERKYSITGDVPTGTQNAKNFVCSVLTYGNGSYNQTIMGAILEGRGACSCYADTFKFITNMSGIQCILVMNEEANHEWVKFKSEDAWVNADPTWEDRGIASTGMYHAQDDKVYRVLMHPIANATF